MFNFINNSVDLSAVFFFFPTNFVIFIHLIVFKMFQMEESDEVFDVVIRYGLYLVAVFQLVCITTVFLLTDQTNDSKVCINPIYSNNYNI